MNENNEQNGLFSDDSLTTEIPKRENPYLKKNRDKAKAEKAPKPSKEKSIPEPDFSEDAGKGHSTQGHRRTLSDWIFEHVKLIVAILTVLAVVALVLVTDVVDVVTNLVTQSQQAEKSEMSMNYVKGLTKKAEPITWDDLDRFRRDQTKAKDSVTWMLPIEGTDYELWISGTSTDQPPKYVYLYHMRTGDRLVIGEEDLDSFLDAHS